MLYQQGLTDWRVYSAEHAVGEDEPIDIAHAQQLIADAAAAQWWQAWFPHATAIEVVEGGAEHPEQEGRISSFSYPNRRAQPDKWIISLHPKMLSTRVVLHELAEETASLEEVFMQVTADAQGGPELLLDAEPPWRAAWIDWADPAPDSIEEGDDSFDAHGVSAAIDTLLDDELDLPGGGFAVIESTRALIAVDVNTGRDTTPAAALKVNIALARELPRQLRLRGLGGQIVIDFAPSAKRDRGTIEQVLRAAFKADGTETVLIGWTAMGLFELNRKRDRVPLAAVAATAGEPE